MCTFITFVLTWLISFPLVMNIIQFWIVDTIVKVSPKKQQPIISRDQSNTTLNSEQDERSPLLPK